VAAEDGQRLPLLLLPRPDVADRAKRGGGAGKLHRPAHGRQIDRLEPQFKRLSDAFERRGLALRAELAGIEPEMALVFKVAGSIQSFFGALRKAGLQWLLETDLEDLQPDDDFYGATPRKQGVEPTRKPFGGSLYLVMSDRMALKEFLSLWRHYQRNPALPGRRAAWRSLFENLLEVRPWGPEDRLRETGLLEDWRQRVTAGQQHTVRAEVELWYRRDETDRRRQEDRVCSVVERTGGRLLGQCAIPEIAYHGLLAEVPAETAKALLDSQDVALLQCDEIMFLRPVGQTLALPAEGEPAAAVPPRAVPPIARLPAIAALLDGLPMESHVQLEGRLEIDDPDGWAADIPAHHRNHGTAMASLILHGDLGAEEPPLETPLHVRPILKPAAALREPPPEAVPEELLIVDLVHRAVRRMLVGEGGEPPTAPGVRIINFSIGDASRPFDRFVSPLARLLDWLAWEHKLLFMVSAGNHGLPLELDCHRQDLGNLDTLTLRRKVFQALKKEAHLRRLLAPAEAMNVLTLGAQHADAAGTYQAGHRIDPLAASATGASLPSPVTAFGPGARRAIKPDIFLPGGRQLYARQLGTKHENAMIEIRQQPGVPPGQRVASPGRSSGSTAATRFLCGTSNAAALATRTAVRLCEQFPALVDSASGGELPERKYLAPLLKACLVHGARWGATKELMANLLGVENRDTRKVLGRYLGFGFLEQEKIFGCTNQRVTLLGWNELGKNEGHLYQIPLPPSLAGKVVQKRLVITLAHLTPLNDSDRRYRKAQLWFSPDEEGESGLEKTLGIKRQEADYHAAARGTVQHEIFEGEQAAAYVEGDLLTIKVNCREDGGGLTEVIPYGLLVTLEVAPGIGVEMPIYEEVRTRVAGIRARLQERVGA